MKKVHWGKRLLVSSGVFFFGLAGLAILVALVLPHPSNNENYGQALPFFALASLLGPIWLLSGLILFLAAVFIISKRLALILRMSGFRDRKLF